MDEQQNQEKLKKMKSTENVFKKRAIQPTQQKFEEGGNDPSMFQEENNLAKSTGSSSKKQKFNLKFQQPKTGMSNYTQIGSQSLTSFDQEQHVASTSKQSDKRFNCTVCPGTYTRKFTLTMHQLNVHNHVLCPKCKSGRLSVVFPDKHLLAKHLKEVHNEEENLPNSKATVAHDQKAPLAKRPCKKTSLSLSESSPPEQMGEKEHAQFSICNIPDWPVENEYDEDDDLKDLENSSAADLNFKSVEGDKNDFRVVHQETAEDIIIAHQNRLELFRQKNRQVGMTMNPVDALMTITNAAGTALVSIINADETAVGPTKSSPGPCIPESNDPDLGNFGGIDHDELGDKDFNPDDFMN